MIKHWAILSEILIQKLLYVKHLLNLVCFLRYKFVEIIALVKYVIENITNYYKFQLVFNQVSLRDLFSVVSTIIHL